MTSSLPSRGAPSQPPKPRLVGDLDFSLLKKLGDRLDIPGEGNWRKLISVLPGVSYDQATVEKFGLNANHLGGSPGYALLTDLSNRGISYDVLITGLKKLHFGAALNDLGYREEVKFKIQPEATPAIEGQKVELRCEAVGVPTPSYLWFKGREPLKDQVSNVLVIERVSVKDAAMYTCRASNDVNIEFSNWAEIIVQKQPVLNRTNVTPGQPQVTDMPVLHQVPPANVDILVDDKLYLSVVATAPPGAQLTYQWLRDTKPLEYGRSSDLVISQVGVKDSGTYNCRVTSDLGGSVLTPSCVVTVIPPQPVHRAPLTPDHTQEHPQHQYGMSYEQHTQPHTQQHTTVTQPLAPEMAYPMHMYSPQDYQLLSQQHHAYPTQYMPEGHYHGGGAPLGEAYEGAGGQADEGAGGQGEQPDVYDKCYDKVALLVGNKNYRMRELQLNTPDRDAQDLAGVLQSAGFKVVSLIDLSKKEMEKAVEYFTTLIGKNVYALFFFAGHGFEYNAQNYMMPVDADVEKKPEQCLCAQNVLQAMQLGGAKLSIMILDMCRVNASAYCPTPMDQMNFNPVTGATGYFLLAFSCTKAERAYEASTDADALREKDKNNSIFVSALKEHLDNGTLNQRLDTLLTDAAAKVRDRGRMLSASANGWMRPEIRHNMAGPLSLADEVKRGPDSNLKREERAKVWQRAHIVPDSVVVGCQGSERTGVKPSEIALRLHFEAEHSNVLIVTAELLNGCLTQVEVHKMTMCLVQDGIAHHPKLKASDIDKEYRFSQRGVRSYAVDHIPQPNDILHFRIPAIQKIRSQTVTLEVEVEYSLRRLGSPRQDRHALLTTSLAPPLYSQVTMHGPSLINPCDYGYHGNSTT